MENLELNELDNDSLIELLSTLNGMNDELERLEGELNEQNG